MVLLITVVTGYFVAQEFAYMSVDRSRLKARAAGGDPAADRALKVTGRTSFMLSGAQLGITVTGLLVGYVAEPLIGQSLGTLLGGVGVPTAVGIAVGTVLALVVSTGVQMVFGELFPKNLAIARPEPVARWLATSTLVYLKLAGWLIWFFDQSSNLLLQGPADRAGARRGALGHRPRPRAHRRRVPGDRGPARRALACCSTGSWTSRTRTSSTR